MLINNSNHVATNKVVWKIQLSILYFVLLLIESVYTVSGLAISLLHASTKSLIRRFI